MIPAEGGAAPPPPATSFSITVNNARGTVGPSTIVDQGSADIILTPGEFRITETPSPNYIPIYSGDCNSDGTGTVVAGSFLNICFIFNLYLGTAPTSGMARLIILKDTIGGPTITPLFPINIYPAVLDAVTGVPAPTPTPITAGAIYQYLIAPGTYSITETTVPGYTPTYVTVHPLIPGSPQIFTSACTGTIAAGQTKICHITNHYIGDTPSTAANLVVQKIVEGILPTLLLVILLSM